MAQPASPLILPRAEHIISRRDIDKDALNVLYRLKNHGYTAYLVGAAWLWHRTRWSEGTSPLRQLGRTSLLVYWVHVEVVYGFMTRWARMRLRLVDATFALALLIAAMLALSLWHTARGLARLRGSQLPAPVA